MLLRAILIGKRGFVSGFTPEGPEYCSTWGKAKTFPDDKVIKLWRDLNADGHPVVPAYLMLGVCSNV